MTRLLPLFLAVIFLSLGSTEGWSLPPCPEDPTKYYDNCFGIYADAEGIEYVGEWRDNKMHGQGAYTYANGTQYVGEFKDNNFHGQGTMYAADGTVLQEGYWEDDELVRSEKVEDRDTGHTAQSDLPPCPEDPTKYYDNCFGIYADADGNQYVGEFRDDKMHGQGSVTLSSGNKYVGEFRDDKMHGQGVYTYANGTQYVGEFKDNNFHGQGTMYAADGTVLQEGYWEDDELVRSENEETVHEPSVTTGPDEIFAAASGSGFAVSSSGYVVTNHHVVDGCKEVRIQHEGTSIPVTIIAHDPINDLALLKGDFTPAETFPLSRRNPKLMQEIFVAGYPFGKAVSSSLKVTKGIVSSLTGVGNNVSHIQIDAALQPGNSGGPIFNDRGNVVAVAVAKLDLMEALESWGVIPENTNFGIKSSVVVNLLDSNNIRLKQPNAELMSTDRLGEMISNSTFYLSCWMTLAQIEELESKRVLFDNLN
jgi:hypothetical protein